VTFTKNDAFVNTPKWSAFFAADVDLLKALDGTFTAHGDYAYKSSVARDAINTPALIAGPQNNVNASLRWTRSDDLLEIKVGAMNLTDNRYIVTGTQVGAVGATTVTWSRPREFYVSLGVKY